MYWSGSSHDFHGAGNLSLPLSPGVGIKGMLLEEPLALQGVKSQEQVTVVEQTWTQVSWERAGAGFQQPPQGWAWEQPGEMVVELELQPGPSALVMASFACRSEQTSPSGLWLGSQLWQFWVAWLGFWYEIAKLRGIFSVCKENSVMFKVFGGPGKVRMSAFLVGELLLF